MAAGPAIGGFIYFAGIKFLGYSAYAHLLRKKWNDNSNGGKTRTFKIGGTRLLIGLGIGISYGFVWAFAGQSITNAMIATAVFFSVLIPARFGEWYWLLKLAFKDQVREGAPVCLEPGLGNGCLFFA